MADNYSDAEEQQMMIDMFVDNSLELLDQIETDLMTLEHQAEDFDSDLVNKVFRAAHTIKGESGFVNLHNIGKLAHCIEEVLDKMRDRELSPTPVIISILLTGFDELRNLITHADQSENISVEDTKDAVKSILAGETDATDDTTSISENPAPLEESNLNEEISTVVIHDTHEREPSNQDVQHQSRIARKELLSNGNAQVLLIDDDPMLTELVSFHLQKENIAIDVAHTAEDGLKMMQHRFYRVVLCDIDLGLEAQNKISCGIELIPKLKQIYPLTQVVMLTGNVTAPNVLTAIEYGATDFLSKRESYEHIINIVLTTIDRAERWSPLMMGAKC